ncbi:hypothetical protein HYT56_05780 [Candidatus Woesearchaeota archaeon]|nr:hypothetical protein [Candidatus Woesearchaeota archaeon]
MELKINLCESSSNEENEPPDPSRVFYATIRNGMAEDSYIKSSSIDDLAHDVSIFALLNFSDRPSYRIRNIPNGYKNLDESDLADFRKVFKERFKVYFGR